MILDTLQLSKDLQPAFEPEQAETLSRALATISAGGDYATKSDLAALRDATRSDLAALRAEVRADVSTQLSTFKVEVVRWIVGAIAFNVLATEGFIITLTRTLVH